MLKKGQQLKDKSQLQSESVMIRLTQAEAEKLDAERMQTPRATFLRNHYINMRACSIPAVNKKAYSELARSASNLNQIARKLNNGDAVLADEIRAELMQFRAKLVGLDNESSE